MYYWHILANVFCLLVTTPSWLIHVFCNNMMKKEDYCWLQSSAYIQNLAIKIIYYFVWLELHLYNFGTTRYLRNPLHAVYGPTVSLFQNFLLDA